MSNYWCKIFKVQCRTMVRFSLIACYILRNFKRRMYQWCSVCGSNHLLGSVHLQGFYPHTKQTNEQTKFRRTHSFSKYWLNIPALIFEETILVESSTTENRHTKLSPLQVLLFAYQIFMECLPCVGPWPQCSEQVNGQMGGETCYTLGASF